MLFLFMFFFFFFIVLNYYKLFSNSFLFWFLIQGPFFLLGKMLSICEDQENDYRDIFEFETSFNKKPNQN